MTDSPQQVWVIPSDPNDMAPLPALLGGDETLAAYDRKAKQFRQAELDPLTETFPTFNACRVAMIAARSAALKEAQSHCRDLAISIEHIRFVPATAFPDVLPKVPEANQQGTQEQEEAEAKEVKPVRADYRPHSRRK